MTDLKRSVWGPATWCFLHASAASTDHPEAFIKILRTLPETLPCPECRKHVLDFLERHPPEQMVVDAQTASRYVFDFHNVVNVRLGKPLADARTVQARYGVVLPELPSAPRRFERARPYRLL
jgi:hypothetical protein